MIIQKGSFLISVVPDSAVGISFSRVREGSVLLGSGVSRMLSICARSGSLGCMCGLFL